MTQIDFIKDLVNRQIQQNKYYTDLLILAVVDRALKLHRGFETLIDSENIQCALVLSRAQIDNIARLHGVRVFKDNASEYVRTILDPEKKITNFRYNGKTQLTDSYLVKKLDEAYPNQGVLANYEEFCAYAHLSERHFWSSVTAKGEYDDVMELVLACSEFDLTVSPDIYSKAKDNYVLILKILMEELDTYFLSYYIDQGILPGWSWRIIFILAILGTGIGFWIRRSLPESLEFIFEHADKSVQKKADIFRLAIRLMRDDPLRYFAIIAIAWLGVAETAAIFVYSPIHMTTINHFSQHQAMGINTIALFFLIPLIPIFGYLSDHYHKIKLLILSSVAFLILAWPYFIFLSSGSYTQILIFKLLFCIPSACYYSIAPVLITESFPTRLRCTSLALIYQITLSLAAGTTPLIMLYLTNHIPSIPYSPAYYLIAVCIFGLIGQHLLISKKTTPIEMDREVLSINL